MALHTTNTIEDIELKDLAKEISSSWASAAGKDAKQKKLSMIISEELSPNMMLGST